MTTNLIKDIIDSYVRDLRNIDSTNAEDYKREETMTKNQFLDCIRLYAL